MAARKKMWPALKRRVYERDNYTCRRCGWRPAIISEATRRHGWSVYEGGRHLELDHILSVALGGTNVEDNLQVLCDSCNRVKGAA